MLSPNRVAVLAALVLVCGCTETPERGFQRAQQAQSVAEWRSFLERHGARLSPPVKSQAEEGLAGALLGECAGRGAPADAAKCLADLVAELPKTQSAQRAAERLTAISGPACSGADDDEACLLDIAERVRGRVPTVSVTEAAAAAAFQKCVPAGEAPCMKHVASTYENTAPGKTAAGLVVDLARPTRQRRALLHEHVNAPESTPSRMLRRSLCLGLRLVSLAGPSEERVADRATLDALLEEAKKMGPPGAELHADDIGGAIKYSGCEVALLQESTILIDPATGAREMIVNGARRPYVHDDMLASEDLTRYQVLAGARRLIVQQPDADGDDSAVFNIAYEGEIRLVGEWATRHVKGVAGAKPAGPDRGRRDAGLGPDATAGDPVWAKAANVSVREAVTCTVPTRVTDDATREKMRAAAAQLSALQRRFRAKVLDAVDDGLADGR